MKARVLTLTLVLAALAAPVSAQSLFGSVGLGLPVDAVDGRARALGNMGLGLSGASLLPTDPAAAARAPLPNGILVAQPSWADASAGAETDYFQGTRFPLVAAGYPVLGGVASVFFSSHLEQDFTGSRETSVDLGGSSVIARDSFDQDGALSSINLGFSRMITRETSVGVSVGRYTGTIRRRLVRTIESPDSTAVLPYISDGGWTYSGYRVTGGAATRVLDIVNMSVSATWSTSLDAEASTSTSGGDGSFDLPLQLRLGASAPLAPGLTLSASAMRADWSGVRDALSGGGDAGVELAYGGGLELTQARLLGRSAPIRLGFRHTDLPFSPAGESASERIFAGGLGLVLNQANELILAGVDVGVERGRRTAGSLVENFWRGTVSLRLAGL
ncbi:MAG: hypothetical protein PVF90_06070 [Gemmatimonadota bacterium]|jgi:hypothetical protein